MFVEEQYLNIFVFRFIVAPVGHKIYVLYVKKLKIHEYYRPNCIQRRGRIRVEFGLLVSDLNLEFWANEYPTATGFSTYLLPKTAVLR